MPNFRGGDGYISPAELAANQKGAADQKAQQQAGLQKYANIAIGDLNSGNYAGALQAGLDSGKQYNTDYNSVTTDPLLQALETSQGLQQLDPSKKWDANSIQQYYAAFGANNVSQGKQAGTANAGESWGQNGYGTWGDMSKVGSDATTNISTQGDNSSPDLMRFVGARPTKSFLGKYGADIAALALTAVSFGVAAPALAATLAADGIATGLAAGAVAGGVMGGLNTLAVDAITGKPITAGGVLGGALGGAAGGGLQGLASGAINDATGLGTTVSGGLAGAGIGAGRAALTGGNVGLGALTGGIGGAVQGSGIAGNIKSGLTGMGVNSGVAGALTNGGINYAIGGINGAAAGALMGGNGGMQPRAGSTGGGGAPAMATGAMGIAGAGIGAGIFSQGGGSNGGGSNGSGAQGNNGNMASTDSTLASTITGALPGVIQGAAGMYGSQNAAEKQTQADQHAIDTQTSTLGNINNIWSKQQGLGQGADDALGTALGTNGKPADYSGFENTPGYKFAVSQGTQAIQRQAASMGNAYTPNTAQAVGQYVTGTASQNYNNYINQLMGAAGLGSTANAGIADPTYKTGTNISQLQQNQGQAQASGVMGGANAVGGAFGPNGVGTSLIGAAGKYLFGNKGGGGGSRSGGGGSGAGGGGSGSSGVSNTGMSTMGNGFNGGSSSNYGGNGLYGDGTGSTTDINNITGGVDANAFSGDIGNYTGNINLSGAGSDSSNWLSGYDISSGGSTGSNDILNSGFDFTDTGW